MDVPELDWRARYARDMRCAAEGHPTALWVWRVNAGGRHLEFYCETCERPVTRDRYPSATGAWVTADWLRRVTGVNADEVPEMRRSLRFHLCHLCGKTDLCEFHHVAPQALYKERADRYPVVPLCEACHDAETREFTARLERYVLERIRRFLARFNIAVPTRARRDTPAGVN